MRVLTANGDDLKLGPDTLAGIFAGTITTWDDKAIAAENNLEDVNLTGRSEDSFRAPMGLYSRLISIANNVAKGGDLPPTNQQNEVSEEFTKRLVSYRAQFKSTIDTDVASFDGGFGSAYLARQVGQKFAREIFFLGREHSADDAHRMGMVNAVVPHADLEAVALDWANTICGKSPTAQRMLKFAFNLVDDGLTGQQVFAGEATRLAYMTDEAVEGRDAFLEKRDPDWSAFPYYF